MKKPNSWIPGKLYVYRPRRSVPNGQFPDTTTKTIWSTPGTQAGESLGRHVDEGDLLCLLLTEVDVHHDRLSVYVATANIVGWLIFGLSEIRSDVLESVNA